jgi:hypothetical protein
MITKESEINKEIINFLRSNITDPNSRASSGTELFSGDGTETEFVITQSGIKAITSIEHPIDTVLTYGTDYTYEPSTQTITFTNAPTNGTDNIEINYLYGDTWIYEDFNKVNMTINDFPRVSSEIISSNSRTINIGGGYVLNNLLLSITVAGKTKQQIKEIHEEIKQELLDNNKSFYHFVFIEPTSSSAFANSGLHDRIIQQTKDYTLPYVFDTKTGGT